MYALCLLGCIFYLFLFLVPLENAKEIHEQIQLEKLETQQLWSNFIWLTFVWIRKRRFLKLLMRNPCDMFLKNDTFINGNLKQAALQVRSWTCWSCMHVCKKAAASSQSSFCGLNIWTSDLANACYKGENNRQECWISSLLVMFFPPIDSSTSEQYNCNVLSSSHTRT